MAGAEIAVRLGQYLALSVLFGASALSLYTPAPAIGKAAGLGWSLAGLVFGLAYLLVLAVGLADDARVLAAPAEVWAMITALPAGWAALGRIALLALAIPCLLAARHRLLVPMAGLALASLAWSGHAAAGEGWPGAARLAVDAVHLLAAGLWLGALVRFLGLVGRSDLAAPVLSRFSGAGSLAVAALLATGSANLVLDTEGRPLAALTVGAWGWLLLVKLALFAAMLALAAVNRFWLTPRLAAGGNSAALRASLLAETGLGAGILVLVAILGRLPPLGGG